MKNLCNITRKATGIGYGSHRPAKFNGQGQPICKHLGDCALRDNPILANYLSALLLI